MGTTGGPKRIGTDVPVMNQESSALSSKTNVTLTLSSQLTDRWSTSKATSLDLWRLKSLTKDCTTKKKVLTSLNSTSMPTTPGDHSLSTGTTSTTSNQAVSMPEPTSGESLCTPSMELQMFASRAVSEAI